METIYLNLRFLTQRITGVQRFAFEICKALDLLLANEHGFAVVGLLPKQQIQPQYAAYVFKNIQLKYCGRLSGHLWEQLELPFYSSAGPLLNFCNSAPIFKLKQFITLHDVIFLTKLDSQKLWFKLFYRLIVQITKLSARRVFTVSQFSKREICQKLGVAEEKVIVLGNAANMIQYRYDSAILSSLGVEGKKYFLMIGSNSLRKNTAMVSQIFAEDAFLASVKLVVAGGEFSNLGTVKDEIRSDNIIKAGYVSDSQLRSLYAHAAALIFPSRYEGFGIPVLEAMAENTPVICADIAVMHEIAANAALYFDPDSPADLAIKIRQIFECPALVRQLDVAAKLQLSNFSWDSFAQRLLEVVKADLADVMGVKNAPGKRD